MQGVLAIDTPNHASIIKTHKVRQFVLRYPSGPGAFILPQNTGRGRC